MGNQSLKWLHVNQVVREQKIGVLAVQELHMDEVRREETENLFKRHL